RRLCRCVALRADELAVAGQLLVERDLEVEVGLLVLGRPLPEDRRSRTRLGVVLQQHESHLVILPCGAPGDALTRMSELRSGSRHPRKKRCASVLALPGAVRGIPLLVAVLDPVLPVLG